MAYFGFVALSAGVSAANISIVYIALMPQMRAYKVFGSGDGQSVLVGAARSSDRGGAYIPGVDDSGRRIPSQLSGKTVEFEVAAGISLRSSHHITLKIRSLQGRQQCLYEWDGRIPLTTGIAAGFKVEGTAVELGQNPTGGTYFDLIMYNDEFDSAGLRSAAAHAAHAHSPLRFSPGSMAPRFQPRR